MAKTIFSGLNSPVIQHLEIHFKEIIKNYYQNVCTNVYDIIDYNIKLWKYSEFPELVKKIALPNYEIILGVLSHIFK